MSIESLMNKTMDVYTITNTKSSTGSATKVRKKRLSDIPCRIRRLTGGESVVAGRTGTQTTHRIYTPQRNDLDHTDEIDIEGDTYDVSFPDNPSELGYQTQIDAILRQ